MSERLVNPAKSGGLTSQTLRNIGLIMVLCGIVGKMVLEQKIMGLSADASFDQSLDILNQSGSFFKLGTVSIILGLIQTCAVPLFAFFLVEGVKHTSSFWKYFLRVLGLAVVSEIPYDLVYHGAWLKWGYQNPAFGLVVAMVMLFLYKSYSGKGFKSVLVNVLATLMALLWAHFLLRVDEGLPIVLITAGLWFSRKSKGIQVFVGTVVTCVCSVFGTEYLRYFLAPLAFLLVHFYNEEQGEGLKILNYSAYPAMLLAVWLVARFVL